MLLYPKSLCKTRNWPWKRLSRRQNHQSSGKQHQEMTADGGEISSVRSKKEKPLPNGQICELSATICHYLLQYCTLSVMSPYISAKYLHWCLQIFYRYVGILHNVCTISAMRVTDIWQICRNLIKYLQSICRKTHIFNIYRKHIQNIYLPSFVVIHVTGTS